MGKKFDKKTAKTYSVVHRSHEDSLYFDNDAPSHVLVEAPQSKKQSTLGTQKSQEKNTNVGAKSAALAADDLARRLSPEDMQKIRKNEGLAAQYGILYDDSNYDYMQHLRPIGQAPDGVFIEAASAAAEEKKPARSKKNIEDIIKDALPSETTRRVLPDELENIPSELQGFKPDMDPRLREVLEALEDEAYVENEVEGEDDIFADLLESGAVDEDEEDDFYSDEGDYDEWDMDNYQDEFDEYDSDYAGEQVELENPYGEGEAPEEVLETGTETVVDNAWERDFQKFKKSQKNQVNDWDSDNEFEDEDEQEIERAEAADEVGALPSISGKKKPKNKIRKKMGAMTDTSSFSMSSSALFRTEGLTLLDDRFEQLAKKFDEEEEDENTTEFSMATERPDLEDMLDDFLDNYELGSGGRKLVKKDKRIDALKEAADSVSRGKAAQRRKKQAEASMGGLGSSFGKMSI